MLRKIIILTVLVLMMLVFSGAAMPASTLVSIEYATQSSKEECTYQIDITVGKSSWIAIKKKETTEEYRYLKKVTQVYQVVDNDFKSKGSFVLTWKYSKSSGAMVYLDSSVSTPINLKISSVNSVSVPQVHVLKPGDKKIAAGINMKKSIIVPSDSTAYVEGKGSYYKLNSVVYTKPLGYTINEHTPNIEGWNIKLQGETVTAATTIGYKASYTARVSVALCNGPLANWQDPLVQEKIIAIDSKADRHYLVDGVYTSLPSNYYPRSENACIYRIAAAHILNIITDENLGCYFDLLSQDLMYCHLSSYNGQGYIPTQPMSEWLMNDYGIGHDFYDTRFNTDTNKALLKIYRKYPDKIVVDKLKAAIKFYVDYYEKNTFTAQGNIFLPDYYGPSITQTPNCSLNHYIAEANFLYNYYNLYPDEDLKAIADSIVDSVNNTSGKWIKPNDDLFYAITPEGEFVGNDYPSVTYNDLISLYRNLEALNMPIGEGIKELIAHKEEWMKNNGYTHLLLKHN